MNETKEIEGHWVGKEKERYDFTLKLPEWLVDNHLIKEEEGTITDDDETVSVHPLVNGDCFTCKATVNRHDKAKFKYGGPDSEHKQTVLNRIKLGKFVE